MSTKPPTGDGPIPEEVERVTNVIIKGLGDMDLASALTVICNLAGQLVCALAEGDASKVQLHANNVAAHVKTAALIKLVHDENLRRAADKAAS